MKKSTLKEVIKSQIKSILAEGQSSPTEDAFSTLRTILAFIKKHDAYPYPELMEKAIDVLQAAEVSRMMDRERGLNESLNPEVSRDVNRYIARTAKRYGYSEQDAVYDIMAALEQRKSDTKYEMPGFGDTMDALDDISIREEDEMDDAEMDKAATKSAKKGDSVATTSNKLQKLVKKMKDKAKEFKAAEGDAKDKIKDELKKMTKEKKQLEKSL